MRQLKYLFQDVYYIYFFIDNFVLLALLGFFSYWTFVEKHLNWALLVLIVALSLVIICRLVGQHRETLRATLLYRALVLLSAALMIAALCIQALRFIYVFLPGLAEPTLSKILVRIGVVTANFYAFAVLAAVLYYLYAHDMTKLIWNGSLDRILESTFILKRRQHWRQIRFSSQVLLYTLVWGGLVTFLALGIGLVAWLLR